MRFSQWFLSLSVLAGMINAAPISALAAAESDEKLPKAVRKTIKSTYPGAKILATSREKDDEGETLYEVELSVKGKKLDLLIDDEGEIEETEKEICLSDLPSAVTKAIFKAYPKAIIEKAEEVTTEGDKVLYEITLIGKRKKVFEVTVVPNGKILKAGTSEADDDKPKAKKKSMEDDEDDDDKPKAKKNDKEDDEDDDDKPKAKKNDKEDDEDDDDKPKAKKKSMEDDEDDDDKPKAKKKDKEDDEDDDDKPKAKKKEKEDDEDDDDKPKAKKKDMEDDEDDDDKPKVKKKDKDDDEDDDDKPKAKKREMEDGDDRDNEQNP